MTSALRVGLSICGRRHRASYRPSHDHDRQHVREHAQDLVWQVDSIDLQPPAQGVGAGEEQRSCEDGASPVAAEDSGAASAG